MKKAKIKPFWQPVKIKPFSPVNLNLYPKRSKKENRLIDINPFGDRDKDRVMNWFDCRPANKRKQEFLATVTKKSVKKYRPQIESIARGSERRLIPLMEAERRILSQVEAEKMEAGRTQAEALHKKYLKEGKNIQEIPINLDTIAVNKKLLDEAERVSAKQRAEYLGYHSAVNILREKPNRARKMIIRKENGEKRVAGFIYEDPHMLATRKGYLPKVKEEATKIEQQLITKGVIEKMPEYMKEELKKQGVKIPKIQVPKDLTMGPYQGKIPYSTDISGKIGEIAAKRVLKKMIPKEQRGEHTEFEMYLTPESRGKGLSKKVIESLMKRPYLKRITATADKPVYEKVWKKTGAYPVDTTGTVEYIAELSKQRQESPNISLEGEEAFKKHLKESITDIEWKKDKDSSAAPRGENKGVTVSSAEI